MTQATLNRVLLNAEMHARHVTWGQSALAGKSPTDAATLEVVVHEMAHCADLGKPLDLDEMTLGMEVRRLTFVASNRNELMASAVTTAVLRKLKFRPARMTQRILSGMSANLHQPEFGDSSEAVLRFFKDSEAEFKAALREPRTNELASLVIEHLRKIGVLCD